MRLAAISPDYLLVVARRPGRIERPEESVLFIERAGREVQRVLGSRSGIIAELKRPQTVDLDRRALGAVQQTDMLCLSGAPGWAEVVNIDTAVAEVTHQQLAAETKSIRRQRKPPRRIELSRRHDAPKEIAFRVVGVDVAETRAGDIVFLVFILHRVCHVERAADVLDAERRDPARQIGIDEGAG